MKSDRKSQRCSTRFALFSACIAAMLFQGCGTGPKDRNGNYPRDVADSFVRAVNANDFAPAMKLWETNSIANVEANYEVKFDEYWTEKLKCDRYELTRTKKGKNGYYRVGFRGWTTGTNKLWGLYLRLVDDEWLLATDRWHKEEDDKMGMSPQSVVSGFAHRVELGDLTSAAELWETNSLRKIESDFNKKFADICNKEFRFRNYEFTKSTGAKTESCRLEFEGTLVDGGERRFEFSLRRIDGRWFLTDVLPMASGIAK